MMDQVIHNEIIPSNLGLKVSPRVAGHFRQTPNGESPRDVDEYT